MPVDNFITPNCVHGVSLEARCVQCDRENAEGWLDRVEYWGARRRLTKELLWAGGILLGILIILWVLVLTMT